MLPAPIYLFLVGTFNFSWIGLYLLIIRRGFKDKASGIPIVALAFNLIWDIFGAFFFPSPLGQAYFNMIFVVLNVSILAQVFCYGVPTASDTLTKWQWAVIVVSILVLGSFLYWGAIVDLNDAYGVKLAFVDTFVNSALFVNMVSQRPGVEGQSLYIGLLKLIGTSCLMIAFTFNPWPTYIGSTLQPILYVTIFLLDLVYVALVYRRSKALGFDPWKRF